MSDRAVETGVPEVPAGSGDRGPRAGGAPAAPFFAGRRRELQSLRSDIERAGLDTLSGRRAGRTRLLLIAGRPGSGRTALAEELARELAPAYPDGVLRARLEQPGGEQVPTDRIVRDLLAGLGRPAPPPGAGEEDLAALLREALADRRILLLLDDAGDPEQVEMLVPDTSGCLVVVTGTGPLTGVPNVRPCTIGGLDPAASVQVLTRLAGSTRITCDPCAADSLVLECAGQPAVLAMLGGWLAARPQASVADAVTGLRDLPPEHSGGGPAHYPLSRALRLVHDGLPQSTARVLRLLSQAPAGYADAHITSALAGCSVAAAESVLESLAQQGVLRPDGAAVPGSPALYRVPGCLAPLLAGLARAVERPAELRLARARLVERFVRQLQCCRAAGEPAGSPARERAADLPRALRFDSAATAEAWLGSRLPALRATVRLALEDGQLDTQVRRLVAALARTLLTHRGQEGAAPELYPLHQLVLAVADRCDLPLERAAALLNLADLDAGAGRTPAALLRYRAALTAARAAADDPLICRALESLGAAHQEQGDWARAADWFGRALSLRLSQGELAEEARLYERLGAVHIHAGEWDEALRQWRAAAAAYRRLRDHQGHARSLSETARVQEYAGRLQESLRTIEEAMELARRTGDTRLRAALQLRMADAFDRLGDPLAAGFHRATAGRLLGDHPE
ncbi:tetratricopeptide repeat protein [Streptomyces meridianus]|uniref:ATP-binding protein n=1 Tax=Streptomyces meridianus TaxID=2938945 RepID=A0ABT0XDI7_9ACTN|nr:ATP-binding protein [Streptomyces meridianus]MCM2580587.1 ATP-binding protein [Streptomyces meridianus]